VRFYERAFGAVELFRNTLSDGTVLFVELALGPGRVLIREETPSLNALAPPMIRGSPVLHIDVDDVDAVAERAIEAGAVVEIPVQEMFWGEQYGVLATPSVTFGRSPPPVKNSPPTTLPRACHPRSGVCAAPHG
jgi:PhnB protein